MKSIQLQYYSSTNHVQVYRFVLFLYVYDPSNYHQYRYLCTTIEYVCTSACIQVGPPGDPGPAPDPVGPVSHCTLGYCIGSCIPESQLVTRLNNFIHFNFYTIDLCVIFADSQYSQYALHVHVVI